MGKKLIIKSSDFSINGIAPEYTLLNWVKSNGKPNYFNTGVYRTDNTKLEVKFSIPSDILVDDTSKDYQLCGSFANSDSTLLLQYRVNPASGGNREIMAIVGNLQNVRMMSVKITDADVHVASIDKINAVIDGLTTPCSKFGTYTDMTTEAKAPIYLLGAQLDKQSPLQIYEVKIYSDYADPSSLIKDYVPVKKADGTICMLEKIGGTYLEAVGGNPLYG